MNCVKLSNDSGLGNASHSHPNALEDRRRTLRLKLLVTKVTVSVMTVRTSVVVLPQVLQGDVIVPGALSAWIKRSTGANNIRIRNPLLLSQAQAYRILDLHSWEHIGHRIAMITSSAMRIVVHHTWLLNRSHAPNCSRYIPLKLAWSISSNP